MRSTHSLPLALGAGWVVLGIVAGVLQSLAGATPAILPRLGLPLAGALWVPLSWAAVELARKVPWGGEGRLRFLLIHGTAAAVAGFILNGAWYAVAALARAIPADAVVSATVGAGLQWAHLHAAAWFVVVAVTHVAEGSGSRTGDETALDAPCLTVSRGQGGVRVPHDAITWIEADGDYVRVHADGRDYLVSRRLGALAKELADVGFVRVHRSAIVNLQAVREVRHRSHGDFEADLSDGTVVRVSRTRRESLLERLEAPGADG